MGAGQVEGVLIIGMPIPIGLFDEDTCTLLWSKFCHAKTNGCGSACP